MIVRVHDVIGTERAAQPLGGAIGDDLVGVHVVRGAGAGLIDVDDEVIAQLTGENLVRRGDDRVGASSIETIERAIRFRGGALDEDRRFDQARRRNQSADGEVGFGARRLHAVVGVGGNLKLAQRIALDPERHQRVTTVGGSEVRVQGSGF